MTVHPRLQSIPAIHCAPMNSAQTFCRFTLTLLLAAVAGCHSMPALHSPTGAPWPTDALSETSTPNANSSLLTAIPDFDETAVSPAIDPADANVVLRSTEPTATPSQAGSDVTIVAPLPVAGRTAQETYGAATATSPVQPTDSPTASLVISGQNPPAASQGVADAARKSDLPPTAKPSTQIAEKPTQATADQTPGKSVKQQPLPKFSERPPETFVWRRTGKSAGGRPFEFSRVGTSGFRTLFVGSAVGNDPAAIRLMDKLARYLHEDDLILGGFEAAVIRTLNPDGAANREPVNALGRYVNGRFPPNPGVNAPGPTPEVEFLLSTVRSFHPQRIVHVRTIEDQSGIIAANQRASDTAQSIAASLEFSRLMYPEQARKGSLEFCLSSESNLDVITLAIPSAAAKDTDLWEAYGDTLLNLIQPDSLRSREASRDPK